VRKKVFSCFKKYPTRVLLGCIAASFLVCLATCSRNEGTDTASRELSEDELYLIEAYANIKHARSYYPLKPAIAESLFVVLDSTIDSLRIAITIRALNEEPDRWEMIFEQLERTLRESASKQGIDGGRSEKPGG
jgi:hypothetical protein